VSESASLEGTPPASSGVAVARCLHLFLECEAILYPLRLEFHLLLRFLTFECSSLSRNLDPFSRRRALALVPPISRIKSAPKPSLTGVHLRMPSAPTLYVCHLLRRRLIVFGAEATSIRGRGDSSSQGLSLIGLQRGSVLTFFTSPQLNWSRPRIRIYVRNTIQR